MDNVKFFNVADPRFDINIISRLTFWWIRPFLRTLKYNRFDEDELYNINFKDRAENITQKLFNSWKEEFTKKNRRANLIKALRRVFGYKFYMHGVFILIFEVLMKPCRPIIIAALVRHYSSPEDSAENPYTYAIIFFVLVVIDAVCLSKERLAREENGMRVYLACSSLVHNRLLKLQWSDGIEDTYARALTTVEKNHDVFEMFFSYAHYLWASPIVVIYVTILLYMHLGISGVCGVLMVLLQSIVSPLACNKFGKRLYCARSAWAREKMDLISETFRKFYITKINGWEKPLKQKIDRARRQEVRCMRKSTYLNGLILTSGDTGTRVSLFITILIYVCMGNKLEIYQVILALLCYLILHDFSTLLFPKAWYAAKDAYKFVKYVETTLCQKGFKSHSTSMKVNMHAKISISNVNVGWNPKNIILRDITLSVSAGTFSAITGFRNVGKSSLLKLILGQYQPTDIDDDEGCKYVKGMRKRKPKTEIKVKGRISYATQEPWLFTGTLKNNITFGSMYIPVRYERIKAICKLQSEFDLLPNGDQTFFEDEKMILSPEFRAKIHLARTLYQDANIYLLDESFLLLDKEIFHDVVNVYLNDKIRMVTMNLLTSDYLRYADQIIFLKSGQIVFDGSYDEYQNYEIPRPTDEVISAATIPNLNDHQERPIDFNGSIQILDESATDDEEQLVRERKSTINYYWKYLITGSHTFQMLALFLQFLSAQVAIIQSDFWLAYWTIEADNRTKNGDDRFWGEWDVRFLLVVFGSLMIAMMTSSFLMRNIIFLRICIHAGEIIHKSMFDRLMGASMRFFGKHSAERTLFQFKKNVQALNKHLPKAILEVLHIMFTVIGALSLLVGLNYLMIIPSLIGGILYYKLYKLHAQTVPNIMRLEEHLRKQIRTEVAASLPGAYMASCAGRNAHEVVNKTYYVKQDATTSARSLLIASMAALDFWLQAVSALYHGIVVAALVFQQHNQIGGAYFGIMVLQMMIIGREAKLGLEPLTSIVTLKRNLKSAFNYDEWEQERPMRSVRGIQLDHWPRKGEIQFDLSSVRFYDERIPALKNFRCTIPSGSKVLIRQKAPTSRSPIVAALFRLADVDGNIKIDGIDTNKIALSKLRSSMSVVSDNAVFFTNTLKESIDPMRELRDFVLLKALETVYFKDHFPSMNVTVEGLSASKQKRISLARAVIYHHKILIVEGTFEDPADYMVYQSLQKVVNKVFKHSTVFVIRNLLTDIPLEDLAFDFIITLNGNEVLIETPGQPVVEESDNDDNKYRYDEEIYRLFNV